MGDMLPVATQYIKTKVTYSTVQYIQFGLHYVKYVSTLILFGPTLFQSLDPTPWWSQNWEELDRYDQ